MARIEEFEAKDVKLTPSDKGYAAVEMAARRIGPLYGQMAAGARELGNLTKGSDEAIGRTAEAFLRFEGLSNQAGNAGVKVGKGGAERTLLGTGAGGDTSWGAWPHEEFLIPCQAQSYRFRLRPLAAGDNPSDIARAAQF